MLFVYLNYNYFHHQKTTCMFLYINESKKIAKHFYIQKARHFSKTKTIFVKFLYTKKPDTLHYTIFHEIFEVGIYIQKAWHFALQDILYTKLRHFAKRNTICVTFLHKKPDTFCSTNFHGILNLEEGGGKFWYEIKSNFC